MTSATVGSSQRQHDQIFFVSAAMVILATVFVGFARTYYLAGVLAAPLPNVLVHIHGAVFSLWILLFITQVLLISTRHVQLHRRLGLIGFGVACLMFLLGLLAATDSLARHAAPGNVGIQVRAFYAVPVVDMLIFATLIYFGFRERVHPAAHKRFMLIATIALLDAAFVRWPVRAPWWDLRTAQYCCYALLLCLAAYDLWSTGKIHRATAWGSGFLIVLQQIRVPLGRTAIWQDFAVWMQNVTGSSIRLH